MTEHGTLLAFWTATGLLTGLGLLLVLRPLLRRGPPTHTERHLPDGPGLETGRGAADDGRGRWVGYVLAAMLPASVVGLYLLLGTPGAVTAVAPPVAEVSEGPQGASEAALREQIPALETRVRASPEDGEAWALLARTRSSLGEYGTAVPAFATASRLLPENAAVWSGYAEALAITRGHQLEGEPYEMALKAVELDMNDPKGLELLGIYHFQNGNYGQAAFYWRRLAKLLPPESPFAQDIAGAAAEATARARAVLDAPAGEPASPLPVPVP